MTPLNAEKYNIAWFKLAEFVRRGEKERALGMYRLLSHSLADAALSHQLEGDILLSFRDLKAVDAYRRAAHIYEQQDKINYAIAMYEHLHTLIPQSLEYTAKLVALYLVINNTEKAFKIMQKLIVLHVSRQLFQELDSYFEVLELPTESAKLIYQEIVLQLCAMQYPPQQLIQKYIKKTVYFCSDSQLIDFNAQLAELNTDAHIYASQFKETKK